MAIVFKNNAKTTLAGNVTTSATSITVSDGSVFPAISGGDTFFCTFDDGTNNEIVSVTAISGNVLTVVRAQDNTTAKAFTSGDAAESRLTAGILDIFSQVDAGEVTADEFIGDLRGAVIFKAKAGEAVSKGDAVYVSGISGNTPIVSLADADDANKMPAFGLVLTASSANGSTEIVTFGTISDIDTSAFSVGDTLYISTTAGELTNSKPTGEGSLIQNMGKVQRSHASAGSIKVGGAGRTNDVPNLNDGNIFIGNASNQAVTSTLDTSIVVENTNLYYTDARVQAVSINNVVEDTTPQLGGNLDLNSSDITGTGDINITGTIQSLSTITATDLLIDTDVIVTDSTNDRVGINKTSPSTTLDVGGSIYFSSILRATGDGSAASPSIQPGNDGDTGLFRPTTNTIGFSTGGTERMRIISTGIDVTGTVTATGGNSTNWNTAYGWGNHASQSYATQSYVGTQISNLVDSSPAALNTLNELAAALGDDANFSTTVNANIATKMPKAGGTFTGGTTYSVGGDAITISSSAPQIRFSDTTSGADDFWIHVNSNIFYILGDRDDSGSWETPHPLVLNSETNIPYAFGNRLFTEAYHPNADVLTTARTIAGTSFNGSANIDISYNNLTNKPTIPTNNNQLTNGAGYTTDLGFSRYNASTTYAFGNLQRFTSNTNLATASGTQSTLEVFSNGSGNDAFMTFHVGADYAIYLGLDGGTNKLSVGGWSMGANSYEIYHSGNKPSLAALGAQAAGSYLTTAGGTLTGDLSFGSQVSTWISSNAMIDAIGWNTSYGVYIGSDIGGTHYLRGNGTFTTGGSTYNLWHTGNDGSGSGLDADLLDGQHGTYYANESTRKSVPSSGNYQITNSTSPQTLGTGYLRHDFLNSAGPPGSSYRSVLSISSYTGGSQWTQLSFNYNNGLNTPIYFRQNQYNGSTWSSWHQLWDSANDGSGSGLDADLLDGLQTASGPTANTIPTRTANGDIAAREIILSSALITATPTVLVSMYPGTNQLVRTTPAAVALGMSAWTSINDGSGSGLDADLLDGNQASAFATTSSNVTGLAITGLGTNNLSYGQTSGSLNGYTGWASHFIGNHGAGATYYMQDIIMPFWSSPKYSRRQGSTTVLGPYDFWTSENDGSGSGLDADLLDGQHGTHYTNAANLTGTLNDDRLPNFVHLGTATTTGYATDDGGWGSRLNVSSNVHAKIEVSQETNSMRSHWYAHTGHDSIKFGTSTYHDVEIQRDGTTRIEAQSDGANITGNFRVSGTTVIDSSRNLTNIGTIQNGSVWINDGTNYNNYDENIRLFNPANTVSVIAFSATGTGGVPASSILGYADRFETRLGTTWRTRVYSSGLYVNGGYYVGTTGVIDSSRNLTNIADATVTRLKAGANFGNYPISASSNQRYVIGFRNTGATNGSTNYPWLAHDSDKFIIHWNAIGDRWSLDQSGNTVNSGSVTAVSYKAPSGNTALYYGFNGSEMVTGVNGAAYYHGSDGGGYGIVIQGGHPICKSVKIGSVNAGTTVIASDRSINCTTLTNTSGALLEIQNGTDGGSTRGIRMWTSTDANWGFYMGTAGSGKSFTGGTACSGLDGRTSHGIRYRVADSTTQIGHIFENANEEALFQIQPDTGNIFARGNVTAYASDERLKTNIKTIENPIEKIKKIRGVEFDWIDNIEETHQFKPKCKRETGVIAQEIEAVIPDAISPAPFNNEYKTVEKDKIVALLIEAIKEQQKEIEYMKSEIKHLQENDNGDS
ncbi:tail fiber domain-containing protein [Candidatus Poseidoniales archaeon]|nr:tail fiber domain-containing protein [Candidatus Poseidoniales archaeon]